MLVWIDWLCFTVQCIWQKSFYICNVLDKVEVDKDLNLPPDSLCGLHIFHEQANHILIVLFTLCSIMSKALFKCCVKDFLSGNDTLAEDTPLINFLNAGDSIVGSGNISSMTYSDIKLLVFAGGIAPLLTKKHCLFAYDSTISTSPSLLFHFEVELSSSVLASCSIPTNAVVLYTVSRCFLN